MYSVHISSYRFSSGLNALFQKPRNQKKKKEKIPQLNEMENILNNLKFNLNLNN